MRDLEIGLCDGCSFSLNEAPHVLISGSTGSGKSYLFTGVIDAMMSEYAGLVKFVMIDPKKVEFMKYKYSTDLLLPVMYDMCNVADVLAWLVDEVEKRYEFMRLHDEVKWSALCDDVRAKYEGWNGYIVVCVDELSDLMMYDRDSARNVKHEVKLDKYLTKSEKAGLKGRSLGVWRYEKRDKGKIEKRLVQLAQKARAAGVHLMLATQRPDASVLSGLLRVNIPTRICLLVRSTMDSIIALGMNVGSAGYEDVRNEEDRKKDWGGKEVCGAGSMVGGSVTGKKIRGCNELNGKGDGVLNFNGKLTRFCYHKNSQR